MKKSLFVISVVNLILFVLCFNYHKVEAASKYSLMTSEGVSYSLDDVVLYESDFEYNFSTDQEVIDYVYRVGYNRVNLCYEYGNSKINFTEAEKELFKFNALRCYIGYQDSKNAKKKTYELYGYLTDGSIANAFQHAYWVMLMCFHTTFDFAIKEAYAHEEYDGNDSMNKHMDLHNDDVAYNKAKTVSGANDDEILSMAKELVESGKLIYIIRNYKYEKEKIYYITSSRTDTIYGSGDFYYYTNSTVPYGVPSCKYTKTKYEIMEGFLMEV